MKKRQKNGGLTTFTVIFTLVGLMLIVIGIAVLKKNLDLKNNGVKVTATITEVDRYLEEDDDGSYYSYNVFVDFVLDGERYRHVSVDSENYDEKDKGREIELYVDPQNVSSNTAVKGMYTASVLLFLMGAAFAGVGIGTIYPILWKKAKQRRIENNIESYTLVNATVDRVERDETLEVNGKNPWVLFCSYEDPFTGIRHGFKSERSFENLEAAFGPGDMVRVQVKRGDYSDYLVMLESENGVKVVDFT